MEPKRVLVIGKTGQLARCLADEVPKWSCIEAEFVGSDECNVADAGSTTVAVDDEYPDAIINTAAFHDLKTCEADFDTAFRVNALGVGNLLAAMPPECHLYKISTDYVFGDGGFNAGTNEWLPIPITDSPNPLNNYGRTKRAGELIALDSGRATVIRTSSLFSKYGSTGKGGSNFLLGMLRRATECRRVERDGEYVRVTEADGAEPLPSITVDSDVVMSPTYTPWLARAILYMVSEGLKPPLAHLVCEGPPVSWYEFARGIFQIGGFEDALARLVPKQADAWPPRPRFSALENSPDLGMGTWMSALDEFFEREWPKMEGKK